MFKVNNKNNNDIIDVVLVSSLLILNRQMFAENITANITRKNMSVYKKRRGLKTEP